MDIFMKSVLIGMSGGVDSSAAAAVLKEQGYSVTGATMRLLPDGSDSSSAGDAKSVCSRLGIEFRELDLRELFKKRVIDYFTAEYMRGRTPNPCIMCNKYLKFGAMLDYAKENGIDYIATGHYAKIEFDNSTEKYILRASDAVGKDQSYVLYNFTQEILSRTLMPLGGYDKARVRRIAADLGLDVASKPDSQEICFVKNNDYADYICSNTGYTPVPGDILDVSGNVIGRHRGLIYYTIGQRKGIGAYGRPMFVMKIDPESNTITLGEKGMEFSRSLTASAVNFISGEMPENVIEVYAKIRYQAKPAKASLKMTGADSAEVVFDEPQRAVTPGQSVVFYDGDIVLGGGIVD